MLASKIDLRPVVVCLALVTAACASDSDGDGDPSVSPSKPANTNVVGSWKLMGYRVAGESRDVKTDRAATVVFAKNGDVVGDDLVNSISGRYVVRGTSLVVSDVVSTAVGAPPSGPGRNCVDALVAVFDEDKPDPTIAITSTGGYKQLTVTRGNRVVALQR